MNQTTRLNRRIVSRGKYIQQKWLQTWLQAAGAFCLMLCFACAIGSLCLFFQCVMDVLSLSSDLQRWKSADINLIMTLSMGMVGYLFARVGTICMQRASSMEAIVPFTSETINFLPTCDSLVRASQEPMQAQESVLLRAATETTERQEELLRATTERQE